MAAEPTEKLAEALRELAQAAYGDPNAAWESPQQLVRDALLATKVTKITEDMVSRAIEAHNSQNSVLTVTKADIPADQRERKMDQWLLLLLTAALSGSDLMAADQSALTMDDLAIQQFTTASGIVFQFLVRGKDVARRAIDPGVMNEDSRRVNHAATSILANEWTIENQGERNKAWVECALIIFGSDIQPYINRLPK